MLSSSSRSFRRNIICTNRWLFCQI